MSTNNGTSKSGRVLVYHIAEPEKPVKFRIVIEGTRYGTPRDVKEATMELMQDMVGKIGGAEVVYVSTARSGDGQRFQGQTPRINPGSHARTAKATKTPRGVTPPAPSKAAERAFSDKKLWQRRVKKGIKAYWAKMTPEERKAEIERRRNVTLERLTRPEQTPETP